MARKQPTKSEREFMGRVAALNCIVCANLGYPGSPAEIHHLRSGAGAGQRNGHRLCVPLCAPHHRTGPHGTAFHAGPKTWQQNFGTEMDLYHQTLELLGESE